MEDSVFMDLVIPAIEAALHVCLETNDPIPCRTSILTGKLYYRELVHSGNEVRFMEVARMRKATFFMLLEKLVSHGLADGRKLCAGEKLMSFIYVLCGNSNRGAQERFQHSGSTITSLIREVLKCICMLKDMYIRLPSSNRASLVIVNFIHISKTAMDALMERIYMRFQTKM